MNIFIPIMLLIFISIMLLIFNFLIFSNRKPQYFILNGKTLDEKYLKGLSIYKVTDNRFLSKYNIEKGSILLINEDTWKYEIEIDDIVLLLSEDAVCYNNKLKDSDIIGKVSYIISNEDVYHIRLGMLCSIKRVIN